MKKILELDFKIQFFICSSSFNENEDSPHLFKNLFKKRNNDVFIFFVHIIPQHKYNSTPS